MDVTGISTGGQDLSWDDARRLASDQSTSGTANYVYDADGHPLIEKDPGQSTLFLADEEIVLDTTAGTLSGTRYYTTSPDGGTTVATRTSSGAVDYLIGDQQGTASLAVNASTLALTSRYYDPYGNPAGTAPSSWPGDKGFVGGTESTATGLTNLGAREYQPQTEAFVSPDSLLNPADPQDLNAYAYASDNPATESDPTGLSYEPDPGFVQYMNDVEGSGGNTVVKKNPNPLMGALAKNPPPAESSSSPSVVTQALNDLQDVLNVPEEFTGATAITDGCIDSFSLSGCGQGVAQVGMFYAMGVEDATASLLDGISSDVSDGISSLLHDDDTAAPTSKGPEGKPEGKPEAKAPEEKAPAAKSSPKSDASSGSGCSFAPSTGVLLASGIAVPISSLKPGDKVLATNTTTGKTSPEKVSAVEINHDHDLYNLKVKSSGHVTVIHTTSNHLFWTSLKQWVPASKLKKGEHLKTADGTIAAVDGGITPKRHSDWMWDLTVPGDNDHDFYIIAGDTAVLVHNCPRGPSVGGTNPDPVLTDGAVDHAWEQHRSGGVYDQQGQTQNVLHPDITRDQFGGLLQQAVDNGKVVSRSSNDPRSGYYVEYEFDGPDDPEIGLQGQNGLRLAFGGDMASGAPSRCSSIDREDFVGTQIVLSPLESDESWRPGWVAKPGPLGHPVALKDLDGESFVFDGYFLCDVQFVVDDVDLSPSCRTAQAVDFVLMLEFARREIIQAGNAEVSLSPSTESWRFEKSGPSLRVSKGQLLGVTTVHEYELAVSSSKKRAYELLVGAHAELRYNAYLARELI